MSNEPQWRAEGDVGQKVLEMADRLAAMQKVAPGAVARFAFELDGNTFDLEMKIRAGT